jgi:uncharacterized protein
VQAQAQVGFEQTRGTAGDSDAAADRLSSVDVLRGVAVLGILIVNIEYFGLPHADKSAAGTEWVGVYAPALTTPAAVFAWTAVRALFEGKMRAIFCMLFGASAVLLTSRLERRGGPGGAADVYYRRTLWLLAFGVAHAYLLWEGDILYAYALAGLFLYPLRRLRARTLLLAGALLLAVAVPRAALQARHRQELRARAAAADAAETSGRRLTRAEEDARDDWREIEATFRPDAETQQAVRDAYRAGYARLFVRRAELVAIVESSDFYGWAFFDALGTMLIGMGLMKAGVLAAARSRRFYLVMVALGYGAGLPVAAWSALQLRRHGFDPVGVAWLSAVYDPARLAVAGGHIGAVMLLARGGRAGWLQRPLADVGRAALSCYLGATVICTTIFNGYGLGRFGKLSHVRLYLLVLGIWCLQVALCRYWLRAFRFGPAEWLWRSLTYGRMQPLRRRSPPPPARA